MSRTNKEYTCIIYITIKKCLKCVKFSCVEFSCVEFFCVEFSCVEFSENPNMKHSRDIFFMGSFVDQALFCFPPPLNVY